MELYLLALDDFGRFPKADLCNIFSKNINVPAGKDSNAFQTKIVKDFRAELGKKCISILLNDCYKLINRIKMNCMLDDIYEITHALINKVVDSNSRVFEIKGKSNQHNFSLSSSQGVVSSIGNDVLNTLRERFNRL